MDRPTEQELWSLATGRSSDLFEQDFLAHAEDIAAAILGRRVLIIGGAGSIGAATIERIATLRPSALHVLDWNENALADLVRRLRSRPGGVEIPELRFIPLDFGSPAARLYLHEIARPDLVLNFAAVKHVRSEKDPATILHMLVVNLRSQALFMRWLGQIGFTGRYFAVSTDKAANPASFMGASKRVMEHVLFDSAPAAALSGPISSARFANVAFSSGSLLQSFQDRLARREPIAAPAATRRYFVSPVESGTICTIAALLADHRTLLVPRLSPEDHLIEMEIVARRFIEAHGYEPVLFEDATAAREAAASLTAVGRWPLLLTPLDTAGEKAYEEFLAAGETAHDQGLSTLLAVNFQPPRAGAVDALLNGLETMILEAEQNPSPQIDRTRLINLIAAVEPGFLATHRAATATLDDRM